MANSSSFLLLLLWSPCWEVSDPSGPAAALPPPLGWWCAEPQDDEDDAWRWTRHKLYSAGVVVPVLLLLLLKWLEGGNGFSAKTAQVA